MKQKIFVGPQNENLMPLYYTNRPPISIEKYFCFLRNVIPRYQTTIFPIEKYSGSKKDSLFSFLTGCAFH